MSEWSNSPTNDDPLNINVLLIDVREPGDFDSDLSGAVTGAGMETVRSMAVRKGAVASVQCIIDEYGSLGIDLWTAKSDRSQDRTAFGNLRDGAPCDREGPWLEWDAAVIVPMSHHELTM